MSRRRYELTDKQFERIEPVLPEVDGRGCPFKDHRQVLNGIFWILGSGALWRDLPDRYGSWKTVYDRFHREPFNVDPAIVQAARAAAGGPNDDKKGTKPAETNPE